MEFDVKLKLKPGTIRKIEARARVFSRRRPRKPKPPNHKPKHWLPTLKQLQQIRWALAMTDRMPFMRCPARSSKKRDDFERLQDYTHSPSGHVCEKCRCDRIAGEGTQGDFYGIGENTGHYGVGFCKWHEKGRRKSNAITLARHQMDAMRAIGRGRLTDTTEFVEVLDQTEQKAIGIHDINDGIQLVKKHIEDFKAMVEGGSLTEKGKDGPQEASDKAKIDMVCKLALTIAQLTKVSVDVNAHTTIPIEDVTSRIKQELNLIPRFILDEKQRALFLEEYRRIWASAIRPKT